MQTAPSNDHFFYLAPIRGITDALFRNIYHKHFPYFDSAIAPFINPQRFSTLKSKNLTDILPENNSSLNVVPQLLNNNPEDFIHLANHLADLGYTHINWNLGCPAPMVANKHRGSGLLPYTERIVGMLEEILSSLSMEISIKTRLGFHDNEDIFRLLPLLEDKPIKEITIHPRIGKQLYRGEVDVETFELCSQKTRHTIVYNGDITDVSDFKRLSQRFPMIQRWMIGRGALMNPFLLAEIKGITFSSEEKVSKLKDFHTEYYSLLREKLNGPGHLLNRMKQLWGYLIVSFPDKQKVLKKIRKAPSEEKYLTLVEQLF